MITSCLLGHVRPARRALVRSLSFLAFVATATTARADPPPPPSRDEATREHRACRALEREDATDGAVCFRVWLERYRSVASPSEVAVAERRASEAPTVRPPIVPKELPERSVEPRKVKATASASAPSASSALSPAVPEPPGPRRAPISPPRTAPAPEESPRRERASSAAPAATKTAPEAPGEVLDFCALAPAKASATFVKQRVVMLSPGGLEALVQDSVLRSASGAELFREVFLSRFPLRRFHNVVSKSPSPAAWRDRGSLSFADVASAVEEDPAASFLDYSARCSDYLVVPIVNKVDVSRKRVVVKDAKGRERTVEQIAITLGASLALYRRTPVGFMLHARVEASVPGPADFASDFGAQAFAAVQAQTSRTLGAAGEALVGTIAGASKLPVHLSAAPDAGCVVPPPRDGKAGLAACGKEGKAPTWLASGGIDERLGSVCRDARSSPEDGDLAMACEMRTRTFQLARALQKSARGVDGWNLFDVLLRGSLDDAAGFGIALGKSEGVEIGHAFQIRSTSGERLAYFKVTDVGPGGDAGRRARTNLDLRSGEAPIGSRVEEYPMIGISILGYGGVGPLLYNHGTTTVRDAVSFRLPSVMYGGGLLAGYDLSEHLGVAETYLRAGGSVSAGSGRATSLTLVTIDSLLEKGVYLGPHLSMFAGIGASMVLSQVKLARTDVTRAAELSAAVFGPSSSAGFDLMLTPELSLRLALLARVPLTRANHKEDEEKAKAREAEESAKPLGSRAVSPVPDWARRDDHLALIQATLGVMWGF